MQKTRTAGETLKWTQQEAQVRVLGVERRQPPRDVATPLQIDPVEKVLNAQRSRSMEGVPSC